MRIICEIVNGVILRSSGTNSIIQYGVKISVAWHTQHVTIYINIYMYIILVMFVVNYIELFTENSNMYEIVTRNRSNLHLPLSNQKNFRCVGSIFLLIFIIVSQATTFGRNICCLVIDILVIARWRTISNLLETCFLLISLKELLIDIIRTVRTFLGYKTL
jgi:hypothetical protein